MLTSEQEVKRFVLTFCKTVLMGYFQFIVSVLRCDAVRCIRICNMSFVHHTLLNVLYATSGSSLTVHEPPVEQRVVDEGFQHGHDTVTMLPQHLHHRVAGDAVVTVQARHLSSNKKNLSVSSFSLV